MNDPALGPLRAGEPIPAARYTSRAFWELERDRLFSRVWLLVAHRARLARPGDFVTIELGLDSLLVVRGDDGRARAFHNVCQHRGLHLCAAEGGRAEAFTCAYHGFRYGRDGALEACPLPGSFRGASPVGRVRLAEIACEERLGFVWASMSPSPEPIDAFLAPIEPWVAPHHPERFTPITETVVEAPCNWKTSVDVNNESYHVRTVHPELLEVVDDEAIVEVELDPHSAMRVPLGEAARGTPHHGRVTPRLAEAMRQLGLDVAKVPGGASGIRAALPAAVRAKAEAEGVDLADLPDEALAEKRQIHVFPNVELNFTPRGLEVFRHRPRGDDPNACFFDDQAYALLPAGAPAPERKLVRVAQADAKLGPVMGADVALLPAFQRGMRSRGFRGLELGAREGCIATLHRAIDRYLFGEA